MCCDSWRARYPFRSNPAVGLRAVCTPCPRQIIATIRLGIVRFLDQHRLSSTCNHPIAAQITTNEDAIRFPHHDQGQIEVICPHDPQVTLDCLIDRLLGTSDSVSRLCI